MNEKQTKVSPKRTIYLILAIVSWVSFIGLEIFASSASSTAKSPHKVSDINGLYSIFGGIAFLLALIALVLAVITTVKFIKSNRKEMPLADQRDLETSGISSTIMPSNPSASVIDPANTEDKTPKST